MVTMEQQSIQIGVSRPRLPLVDLPTPEEVFDKPKIGTREIITVVLGPSVIALGAALGSGEWLLGPLAFGRYGFTGLGWLHSAGLLSAGRSRDRGAVACA